MLPSSRRAPRSRRRGAISIVRGSLRVDEVATEEQVEDLTTAWRVARANLDTARFNARFAHIDAPADGVVLQRLAEEDELVQAGEPVLVIGAYRRAAGSCKVALADRDAVRVDAGDAARRRVRRVSRASVFRAG